MAEVTKVTETSSQGLEPVNFKLISQYDQLRALLASRLTADHAFLLAEPVPLGGSKERGRDTAWYVAGSGDVVSLGTFPSDQIDTIEQHVRARLDDISRLAAELVADGGASRELGRLLLDALVFPDTMQVFLVGNRPVLVNWGYRKQAGAPGAASTGNNVMSQGREPKPAPGPPGRPISVAAPTNAAPPPPEPPPPSPPPPPPPRQFGWRRAATIALWTLFVVLLLLIGIRLLDACALGSSKWPAAIRNLLPGECSGTSAEIQAANDDARALEAMIHQKQLILATRLAECKAACAPTTPTPAPPIRGGLTPAEIDQTLPRNTPRGKVEVTLAWKGLADVDLHIICPNDDQIHRQALANCGGKMVTDDLNKGGGNGDASTTWVEHVIWETTPVPNGAYQVRAVLYTRSRDTNPSIPVTAVLRVDGNVVKSETSALTAEFQGPSRPNDTIFTFNVPADTAGGRTNAR